VHSLPIFVRLQGRPVILIGTGPAADAKRRLLEDAGAQVVGEDAQAQLAIVVDVDAAVACLKARGVLVNAVDRPDLCDFTLPAIVDRSPVIVAIGTGGASAGLAKALRQRLELLLPQSLGKLAEALHTARDRIRARWPDMAARRAAIDDAMVAPLNPLRDLEEGAVERWLDGFVRPEAHQIMITVDDHHIIDGVLFDLPLSAAHHLGQADVVVTDLKLAAPVAACIRRDARICATAPDATQGLLTVYLERAYG
jgi:uroporphyrin-III C-methyltransferase / precorrin-2 dehydrogenase / sirohydrochlorin ferrochelatase